MLYMLAKDGYEKLKQKAEDGWRWCRHVNNLMYSRILEEEDEMHRCGLLLQKCICSNVICVSVCVLVMTVNPAKMAEPIEMAFEWEK